MTTSYNKDAPIYRVLGNIDELSVAIGAMRLLCATTVKTHGDLVKIQKHLMQICTEIHSRSAWRGSQYALNWLLGRIDAHKAPEKVFVLAGSNTYNVAAHTARVICRRAERSMYASNALYTTTSAREYINKLGFFLFLEAEV